MGTSQPLVSFICPTGDRAVLLRRALLYMRSQDLTEPWEAVIVDGGRRSASTILELSDRYGDERFRLVRVDPSTTLGTRRNVACEAALGSVIIHIDDDDWYAPAYARRELAALEHADLVSVRLCWCYHPTKQRGWRINAKMEGNWGGNAMAYRRELWKKIGGYPDANLSEDRRFIEKVDAAGYRLNHYEGSEELVVHMRHRFNVTGPTDPIIDPAATAKVRSILGDDVHFYDDLAELVGEAQRAAEIGPLWHLPAPQRAF